MRKIPNWLKNIWKQLVLIALLAMAFSYAMFQGGFVSWFLFYSFIPFAVYGILLSFYRLKKIKINRYFETKKLQAGDKLIVTMKIERTSIFPLFYLVIEDEISSEYWPIENQKTILFPWFRRKLEFNYELENIPRGEHIFHRVNVKIGDLIGLIEKQQTFTTEQDKIIVLPAYEEMTYQPIWNFSEHGRTASQDRWQKDTTMAVGLRQYQPGDRFSWINWKATAKKNEIMTKEFEQGKSHNIFIIMDCMREPRFEIIVSFAASIFRAVHRKGVNVGFLAVSKERIFLPIRHGEAHEHQLFYHLAKVQDNSSIDLERVLDTEDFYSLQHSAILLITSQLTRKLIEKASFLAINKNGLVIFLIKNEMENLSEEEYRLKRQAAARGVKVIAVYKGRFQEAFTEVERN